MRGPFWFSSITRSLMVRTVVSISILLGISIVIAIIGATKFAVRDAQRALEERAHLTVQILAGGASEALWNLDEFAAQAILGTLSRDPDYLTSAILDENGEVLIRDRATTYTETRVRIVTVTTPLYRTMQSTDLRRIGTLELSLTTARAQAESLSRSIAIAIAGGVFLLIVCGALALIIHEITRPICGMTDVMTELARGKVDVTVPRPRYDDEIGRMADALTILKSHAAERLEFIAWQAQHVEETERLVRDRTQALTDALEDLRRAGEDLVRSEKMAALGGMMAAIAHEINTPLGNALTVATTLNEKVKDFGGILSGKEIRRSMLKETQQSLETGSTLLTNNLTRAADLISSFKRVAVDQTSERRRLFDLAQQIEETVALLKPSFKHKDIRVELAIETNLKMDSYPGALSQIITNLVANAIQHAFNESQSAGVIRIESADHGEPMVTLTITDNGVGISEEILPRIFDPFFTTKLGSGGSGLGLHIVYVSATRILGGQVRAESERGRGTRFSLMIPRTAPMQTTSDGKDAQIASGCLSPV